jgi:zinc transporter, ZIP family
VLSFWQFALWMLVGVAVFLVADKMVETRFGEAGVGGAMGIVVGSVVDGVPESLIFGIQVGTGFPISLSFLGAVFISNIPQSIAPSADLSASGWSARRVGTLWLWVVLACALAAALGYLATDLTSEAQGGRAAALAAGGLLAMLTNSLMPFSFERGGALAGAATAVGFCVSLLGNG